MHCRAWGSGGVLAAARKGGLELTRTKVDPLGQKLPLVHLLQLRECAGEEVHADGVALPPARLPFRGESSCASVTLLGRGLSGRKALIPAAVL